MIKCQGWRRYFPRKDAMNEGPATMVSRPQPWRAFTPGHPDGSWGWFSCATSCCAVPTGSERPRHQGQLTHPLVNGVLGFVILVGYRGKQCFCQVLMLT